MKRFLALFISAILLSPASLNLAREEGRIFLGREANDNEFPWMVFIRLTDELNCSGFLISSSYLVTAAHCMANRSVSDMAGVFGNVNREQEEMVEFESFTMHPNYDYIKMTSDVAVMKLKSPLTFTEAIKPICLGKEDSFYNPGNNVLEMGWGRDRNDSAIVSKNLKVTDVGRLLSKEECRPIINDDENDPPISLEGRLCVKNANGEGVCEGDSGGPIVYQNGSDFVAIGLVSIGFYENCSVSNHYPEITTHIGYFSDWIAENVDEPVCMMV